MCGVRVRFRNMFRSAGVPDRVFLLFCIRFLVTLYFYGAFIPFRIKTRSNGWTG